MIELRKVEVMLHIPDWVEMHDYTWHDSGSVLRSGNHVFDKLSELLDVSEECQLYGGTWIKVKVPFRRPRRSRRGRLRLLDLNRTID